MADACLSSFFADPLAADLLADADDFAPFKAPADPEQFDSMRRNDSSDRLLDEAEADRLRQCDAALEAFFDMAEPPMGDVMLAAAQHGHGHGARRAEEEEAAGRGQAQFVQARTTATVAPDRCLSVTVASTSSDANGSPSPQMSVSPPATSTGAKGVATRRRAPSALSDASSTRPAVGGQQQQTSDSNAAVYARQYRNKNKMYVRQLEDQISVLDARNSFLKRSLTEQTGKNDELRQEVSYLRSVLANEGPLANIIRSVASTPGLDFTFPLSAVADAEQKTVAPTGQSAQAGDTRKRRAAAKPAGTGGKKAKTVVVGDDEVDVTDEKPSGPECDRGVCVHVRPDSVALRFCARCARNSRNPVLIDRAYRLSRNIYRKYFLNAEE